MSLKILAHLISLGVLLIIPFKVLGVTNVVYPSFQSDNDSRFSDLIELLQLSLDKTKKEYGAATIKQASDRFNEKRAQSLIKSGVLDVIWYSSNSKIEEELYPIRIPLRKGLMGFRIFLINKENQKKFSSLKTLAEFKKLSVGQGADWGDVGVFRANKIEVFEGSTYEGLFQMVVNNRFDYFSRGVNEAIPEWNSRKKNLPKLGVEKDVLLFYPWPYYFFVSKKNKSLGIRIKMGLEKAIQDGSFNKIFYKYHLSTIQKSDLKNRKMFKIPNPLLPKETPLSRKELWLDPLNMR